MLGQDTSLRKIGKELLGQLKRQTLSRKGKSYDSVWLNPCYRDRKTNSKRICWKIVHHGNSLEPNDIRGILLCGATPVKSLSKHNLTCSTQCSSWAGVRYNVGYTFSIALGRLNRQLVYWSGKGGKFNATSLSFFTEYFFWRKKSSYIKYSKYFAHVWNLCFPQANIEKSHGHQDILGFVLQIKKTPFFQGLTSVQAKCLKLRNALL